MPFTFSHPAMVLPFTYLPRKWFSLTGLAIGSLTPDFEYFLRMRMKSEYSHTIAGIFWFDLPLGILLAYIFHNFVRDSLIENSPKALKSRFLVFERFNWNQYLKKNWLVVAISILIGAGSHILWDGFTHERGFFAERISLLTSNVNFLGIQLSVFKILQHSSTLIGGLVIAFSISKLQIHTHENKAINKKYWLLFLGIAMAIVGVRVCGDLEFKQYGNVIATVISAGLISLIITPLIIKSRSAQTETL